MSESWRPAAVCITASLATLAIILVPRASADGAQLHGSVCQPYLNTVWSTGGTYGVRNSESVADVAFICPVPSSNGAYGGLNDDGDNFDHMAVDAVLVHVADQNPDSGTGGQVRAQLCITFAASSGGSCGSTAATTGSGMTGTGARTLFPADAVWTQSPTSVNDYPTIVVVLPDTDPDYGASAIMGFTVHSS